MADREDNVSAAAAGAASRGTTLRGKRVVVTGAATGIGRAIALRGLEEGAEAVLALDLSDDVAAAFSGLEPAARERVTTRSCDVSREPDLLAALDSFESSRGPIDVFCANAGILVGGDEQTDDRDWGRSFAVNVMAHILAARALVPRWLERGGGCFVVTASAAGLLSQVGNAPYAVTKHAAVAFAEWLSITYGDAGIQVCCLCPMGVDTNMTRPPAAGGELSDSEAIRTVAATSDLLPPAAVADSLVDALAAGRFLALAHPEVGLYFERRAVDHERWLAGMRRLQARVAAAGTEEER